MTPKKRVVLSSFNVLHLRPVLWLKADGGVVKSTTGYAGTGTITSLGTTVTGSGTSFLGEVKIGDTITATLISGTVTAIASATSLTLNSSNTQAVGQSYTITPVAGASDRVTTWQDQSGNGNHATQATAAVKPALKLAIKNRLPVVRFDGTDDFLTCGDVCDLLTSDISVFVVAAYADTSDGSLVAKSRAAVQAGRYGLFRQAAGGGLQAIYANGVGNQVALAADSSTAWRSFAAVINRSAGTNKLYVNGSIVNTASFTAESTNYDTVNRLLLGAYGDGTDAGQIFYLNGDIAEVAICLSTLTDTQIGNWHTYAHSKWGIS